MQFLLQWSISWKEGKLIQHSMVEQVMLKRRENDGMACLPDDFYLKLGLLIEGKTLPIFSFIIIVNGYFIYVIL